MKLLLLNYEFPPLGGGASPVSFEIGRRLVAEYGFDIDVVTMGFEGLPARDELSPGMRVYRVPCWRSKKEICHPWEQATYLFTGYRKAAALHRNKTYDICHTHFLIPTGLIAEKLHRRFGLPYVVTAHGSDVPGFNNDRFKLLHTFTGPLLRRVVAGARRVVAPSAFLEQLMRAQIRAGFDEKLCVIPNGIAIDNITPASKRNIILGTGRLLPRKGFQHLLQAVADEVLGYEVHICGDGPMMATLKDIQKRSKTKIVLHGWMDNRSAAYRKLLETAAIYVLPSLKENASIALLEAMAVGAAVVTTNVSGCPETVGPEGLLVEPENASAIREVLLRLVKDEALRQRCQQAMRARVEKVFSWDRVIAHYRDVLS
ncbi:MAG: glycosyltransferase family 4 protein [Desulfuromonadales bacterium]